MAAPAWMPNGVVGWPPTGLTGGIHTRLLGFVKTALLRQLVPPNSLVCDLFCGRGIDTERWAEAGIGRYVGVDLSASALQEAKEQWEEHGRPFPAEFCELDPCMVDLEAHLQDQGLPADMVCCLAHLQDSFTSEDMVKRLLKNVAAVLKPGGFFFGTAPDSSTIWYKYQKAVEVAMKAGSLRVNGTLPSVRTDIYKISFDDDRFNTFGSKYHMRFADDGLPAQPQLLVHFPSLIRLAKEVGLECVEIQNLWEFYDDYSGPFGDVLRSCCGSLVDLKGAPLLDAKGRLNYQALDVLSLYTSFIFKKGDASLPNFQISSASEHVSKASNLGVKYPTYLPSQHFETFAYSMNEEPAREDQQVVKVDDHGLSALTNATISNLHHSDHVQQDSNPQNSGTLVVDHVEELSDSGAHCGTTHDQEEGVSEVVEEANLGHKRQENMTDLDSHNQFHGSIQDLKKKHNSRSDRFVFQMGTEQVDGGVVTKGMHQLAMGETEFRTWPSKETLGARTSSSMEKEDSQLPIPASKGHRTSRGSSRPGPLVSTELGQVNLGEVEKLEEQPQVPADHSSKHYMRRTNGNLDESGRAEKQRGQSLRDHSPKHYMQRTHESHDESKRSARHQELPLGDTTSKHYQRRTYDSRDEGNRREKQQEPRLADHTTKNYL